ncbi:MAG: hypothetical protein Q8L14_39710 [Myxococcales bacterium]|nr:hypothetical protein [Myxococcales bacterium]
MNTLLLVMLGALDGGVPMTAFATPKEAFVHVLATRPQILGVGEYHELKGAPKVPSAIRHFTAEALPVVDGGATSMIVETWMLNGRCGEVEKQAAAAVEKTTKRPVETEDEITTMMGRAYDLGLKNHTLLITCADYASMLDADKELDAEKSLLLMKSKVEEKALEVRENEEGGLPGKMLILYGGALHNDLEPAVDDAPYSFGPRLRRETNGGYAELDLLVPEYVERDDDLLKLPWFPPALALAKKGKTVLVQPSRGVNVIVFAYSKVTPRRR